ncbi:hypothetical protein SBRY_140014 [Actinacidiphila bryophytorum]|uniref:Uncharacterized protein n=1 Tax=Actinacidiphila bryophytorum TaxID=1436133 RepID=A0A9W4E8X0_9ACTN|nr:hypothetical protein SBRY_140014 [Actinacidiphila bryophytorum]
MRTRETEAMDTPARAAIVSTVGGPSEVGIVVPSLSGANCKRLQSDPSMTPDRGSGFRNVARRFH